MSPKVYSDLLPILVSSRRPRSLLTTSRSTPRTREDDAEEPAPHGPSTPVVEIPFLMELLPISSVSRAAKRRPRPKTLRSYLISTSWTPTRTCFAASFRAPRLTWGRRRIARCNLPLPPEAIAPRFLASICVIYFLPPPRTLATQPRSSRRPKL